MESNPGGEIFARGDAGSRGLRRKAAVEKEGVVSRAEARGMFLALAKRVLRLQKLVS
jgi:hypothetical protein